VGHSGASLQHPVSSVSRNQVRIVVTGGSGLLGRPLVGFLRKQGFEVVSHSRSHDTDVRGDLLDVQCAHELVRQAEPEALVHLAGLTNVDECEADPDSAYRINVRTVENLVDSIHTCRFRTHLVLISTDQVYDAPGLNCEEAVVPRNTYALTKLLAEKTALQVNATVIRTNFFGKSHTPGRKSLSDWIIEQAASRAAMTLLTDVRFSPLSMDTVCAVVQRVLQRPHQGVFNAGSREGMSKRDFAHRLARRLKIDLQHARDGTTKDLTLRARRPHDMIMDSARFEQAFDFELPTLEAEISTAEL
jgi:dTDP-4-dehydrorhamnose reductase